MLKKLRQKWRKKTPEQRKLFFEAYFYTIYFEILIKTIPFKKIVKITELKKVETEQVNSERSLDIANIKSAIFRSGKYSFFKPLCLNQALVAQRMLQKRKISGLLFLGVGKDDQKDKKLIAHAWLKCNNKIITGDYQLEKYAVVAKYTW